jgi:hypothetical protein
MTNIISALHVFPLSAALVSQSQRAEYKISRAAKGLLYTCCCLIYIEVVGVKKGLGRERELSVDWTDVERKGARLDRFLWF